MRRKRRDSYRRYKRKVKRDLLLLKGMFFLCLLLAVLYAVLLPEKKKASPEKDASIDEITYQPGTASAPPAETEPPADRAVQDERIYTFLQGPKSWKRGIDWSGEWGDKRMDGGYFGGFGCGLCCMANIYSTLTEYESSPVDMYRYAKKHTGYLGGMAIDWGYMRRTLTSLGFDCYVANKPESYQQFSEEVRGLSSCIVLVSSNASKVYWKNTPGHYVTIFDYEEQSGTVFLADSGDPKHNRSRVALRKIYRSLKTESAWQYLAVKEYIKKDDAWKHKTASGDWHRPDYFK